MKSDVHFVIRKGTIIYLAEKFLSYEQTRDSPRGVEFRHCFTPVKTSIPTFVKSYNGRFPGWMINTAPGHDWGFVDPFMPTPMNRYGYQVTGHWFVSKKQVTYQMKHLIVDHNTSTHIQGNYTVDFPDWKDDSIAVDVAAYAAGAVSRRKLTSIKEIAQLHPPSNTKSYMFKFPRNQPNDPYVALIVRASEVGMFSQSIEYGHNMTVHKLTGQLTNS